MSLSTEIKDGYIRAQAELKLLDSAVIAAFNDSGSGYLDLMTDDGRLRLKMTHGAAEDLLIDLQLFLATKPAG